MDAQVSMQCGSKLKRRIVRVGHFEREFKRTAPNSECIFEFKFMRPDAQAALVFAQAQDGMIGSGLCKFPGQGARKTMHRKFSQTVKLRKDDRYAAADGPTGDKLRFGAEEQRFAAAYRNPGCDVCAI